MILITAEKTSTGFGPGEWNSPDPGFKTRTGNLEHRVLIVEDDPKSRQLLELMLRPLGLKVNGVEDGDEAIRFVTDHPDTSLILMDLKLPRLDGYKTTRMIKEIKPHITVIAQTAYAESGDREKAVEAGCNDYLTKPISSTVLLPMIRKYLNGWGDQG